VCGIVGLHLKNPDLQPRLGELLSMMLEAMTTRGPDSAGIAIYTGRPAAGTAATASPGRSATDPMSPGHHGRDGSGQPVLRYSLRAGDGVDWDLVAKAVAADTATGVGVQRLAADCAVLESVAGETVFLDALRRAAPGVTVAGYGRAMVLVKDVGAPADICARYGIGGWSGYQGVGHTRMATESAVTTAHSHPFAPAADLALVHNGSFSNYATVRGRLERAGIHCDTDNDSEVAARLVAMRLAAGDSLDDALRVVLKEMDGFFTLLVTTATQFAVVRDSFACKPAVIAQTGDYVAMASEYVALAGLPGIAGAEVFEPMPEEIHTWSR
jgi:glutamate synthase domain-containing protein 1